MGISGKELAKILNLSEAAISLALNNKPGVSTHTRKKIIETAKTYGYDFSSIALQEEKPSIKGTIDYIIYKKHGAIVADTPFFGLLSEGVDAGCQLTNYYLNTHHMNATDNIEEKLNELLTLGSKGIILLGTEMQKEDFLPFKTLPVPIVLLDCYYSDIMFDCITVNNIRGAYLATNHLIENKMSHPGYLHSSYKIQNFYERRVGYYKAVRANGLSSSRSVVHRLSPSLEDAYADMMALIERGEPLADCYFADNDLIAAGAMKAFKASGYHIPDDIAIIGFDDLPLCEASSPTLSSIHVPTKYMAELAVKRLVDIITSETSYPIKIEVETSLNQRKSV